MFCFQAVVTGLRQNRSPCFLRIQERGVLVCVCVWGGGGWQANTRRPGCCIGATEPGEVHHQLLHALFGCNLLVQSIPLPAACLESWLGPGCVYNLEPDGRQDRYPLMLERKQMASENRQLGAA
jgi:hypothetical protein